MAMQDDKHWVEDLFPVRFTFDSKEEICSPLSEVRAKLDRMLDRVYQRDAEAIRNIYLRVLAIVAAEESVKEQVKVHHYVTSSTQTDLTFSSQDLPLIPQQLSEEKKRNDIHLPMSQLWTDAELTTLRDHYRREHDRYLEIKVELRDCREELDHANKELVDLRSRVSQSSMAKSDRLAGRLSEVNEALKLEIVRITNQLNGCEKELQEEKTQHRIYESRFTELSRLNTELSTQLKIQEQAMSRVRDDSVLDADRQMCAMKLKYESEIEGLIDRMNSLQENLDEERRLHGKSKAGLNQLRLHFSQSPHVYSTSGQLKQSHMTAANTADSKQS